MSRPISRTTTKGAAMARSFGGQLYRAARTVRTVEAVGKGRAVKRARNVAVGRTLGRVGFWRRLWK